MYKEPPVKQPIHPHDPRDAQPSETDFISDPPSLAANFTGVQKSVLDSLGNAGKGLTLRQLETAVGCSAEELKSAVDSLLQASLVSRLNTVIPSYATRYPGVRVYGE